MSRSLTRILLLDNDGGDHAEHSVFGFRMVQDMAMECPGANLVSPPLFVYTEL
jgi:hypothetical protein